MLKEINMFSRAIVLSKVFWCAVQQATGSHKSFLPCVNNGKCTKCTQYPLMKDITSTIKQFSH